MTTRAAVDDFLAQRTLALVGASRDSRKFSNRTFKELRSKGFKVIPVNPHTDSVDGERSYPNLSALPEKVGGVLIMVPPQETEKVVRDAEEAGIRRVWMQQGAESEQAVRFCTEKGMSLVYGECILMFAEPVGFGHRLHRWLWGLLGKLPK